jgi:hypothetical protein
MIANADTSQNEQMRKVALLARHAVVSLAGAVAQHEAACICRRSHS